MLTQMMEQQPNRGTVLQLMSRLRFEQFEINEGIDFLKKAIALEKSSATKGALFQELGFRSTTLSRFEEATTAFKQSIACDHDLAVNFHNLAIIERNLGHLDQAEQLFRDNIHRYPESSMSYSALSSLRTFSAEDPLFDLLHDQLNNRSMPSQLRGPLYFALGSLYADIGEHCAAFNHFHAGNRCLNNRFNWQKNRTNLQQLKAAYQKKALPLPTSTNHEQPVFIVGMPRSGTSLIEQVLASHPEVFGAGETLLVARQAQKSQFATQSASLFSQAERLNTPLLNSLAEELLENFSALNQQKPNATRTVEKTPTNFVHVGLILQLYPNAKIIHTVRHPLDTCLSCYFTNFTDKQEWSFNLESLGKVYEDYASLMQFWHQRYPGKILDVEYEQMVTHQENQTRTLLDFIGVDWNPACMDFHKSTRPVQTASFAQVRKPLYSSSLSRWKTYARQLRPVADILGIDIHEEINLQAAHSSPKQ